MQRLLTFSSFKPRITIIYVAFMLSQTVVWSLFKFLDEFTHQSIPAAPIPPGNCGAFAHPVSSGGGALANLARPGGWAFAYPGAAPGVLTHSWFPTRNPNMEDLIAKDQQYRPSWTRQASGGFTRFYAFLHCLSRHNSSYHYM